jgi:hypothetical protein
MFVGNLFESILGSDSYTQGVLRDIVQATHCSHQTTRHGLNKVHTIKRYF